MFCKDCGTENDTEAKFCKSCGQPLNQEQPQDAQNAQDMGSVDSSQKTYQEENQQNAQNENTGQDRSMYKYNYNSGDSDATVALIMGVVSIVMCSSSIVGIGLGIMAIILAGKAKRQGSQSKNISAGQVCGIIGICLSSLATIYYLFVFVGLSSFLGEFLYELFKYVCTQA